MAHALGREGGVAVRDLQRRGEHVALTDREVDVVAGVPLVAVLRSLVGGQRLPELLLPRRIGDDPAELTRQLDARGRAVTELAGGLLDAIAVLVAPSPELVAEAVEVRVAGDRDGPRHLDRPVHRVLGVAELAVADRVDAGVVVVGVRADDALRERGVRGDELEGRAGRVQAGDGPVDRGVVGRFPVDPLPVAVGVDPVDELGRVVGGVRRHGDDVAVARIEHDARTDLALRDVAVTRVAAPEALELLGELLLGGALDVHVDGQLDVAAGYRRPVVGGELAHHLAVAVDLDLPDAGRASQVVLERLLDPGLADRRVGFVRLGRDLGFFRGAHAGLELVAGDAPHVAHDVRGEALLGVRAHGLAPHLDSREVVGALGQEDHEVFRDVDGHRHRLQRAVLRIVQAALDRGDLGGDARRGQLLREPQQQVVALGGLEVLQAERIDGDHQGCAVVDEHAALRVEDATAGRLLLDGAHPVVGGLDLAFVGRHDLQVVEAGEEGGEEREDDDAQDAEAQARGLSVHS